MGGVFFLVLVPFDFLFYRRSQGVSEVGFGHLTNERSRDQIRRTLYMPSHIISLACLDSNPQILKLPDRIFFFDGRDVGRGQSKELASKKTCSWQISSGSRAILLHVITQT